jgi:hypothetical protein
VIDGICKRTDAPAFRVGTEVIEITGGRHRLAALELCCEEAQKNIQEYEEELAVLEAKPKMTAKDLAIKNKIMKSLESWQVKAMAYGPWGVVVFDEGVFLSSLISIILRALIHTLSYL